MKYLVAGLGNIGPEYRLTRHNIGFAVADALVGVSATHFEPGRLAEVAHLKMKGKSVVVIKPNTYMNLSGKAVAFWIRQEKIPPENVLVVLDDLALPFGKLRMRAKGSDGGHNGLRSIDFALGSNLYARLRFGIGSSFIPGQQIGHVLGTWSEEERKALPLKIDHACKAIHEFVLAGPGPAMTKFNAD